MGEKLALRLCGAKQIPEYVEVAQAFSVSTHGKFEWHEKLQSSVQPQSNEDKPASTSNTTFGSRKDGTELGGHQEERRKAADHHAERHEDKVENQDMVREKYSL